MGKENPKLSATFKLIFPFLPPVRIFIFYQRVWSFELVFSQSNFIQGTCHIELFPHRSPVS